jgi:serine/threonine protein kinase
LPDEGIVKTTHPKLNELVAFTNGRLDRAAQAEIERHVAECSTCCQVLRELPEDTLVERLRRGDTSRDGSAGATKAYVPIEALADNGPPKELLDHPRYRIVRKLGAGGMGVVYQAEHRLMERQVALKVINRAITSNPVAVERFRVEVRLAAKLAHPNIVAAHDADEAGDLHFLVMEYVEGASLDRVVQKNGPLSVYHATHFVQQAARGLQHAFEKGMVHRDIKPQNLMLTPKKQVKILDFGLARIGREVETSLTVEGDPIANAATQLTAMGALLGTPDYMAPEQITDPSKSDIRSDIYSLGCTLYYLLSGRVPFPDTSVFDKLNGHIEREPQPITELRDDIPADLNRLVKRMMAKDPVRRFQTPADVIKSLAPFAKTGGSVADDKSGNPATGDSPIVQALFEESAGWRTQPSPEETVAGSDSTYDLQAQTEVIQRGGFANRRRSIAVNGRLFALGGAILAAVAGLFWIVPKLRGPQSSSPSVAGLNSGGARASGTTIASPRATATPASGSAASEANQPTGSAPVIRSTGAAWIPSPAVATSAEEIRRLSDEFDQPGPIGEWIRLYSAEGLSLDRFEQADRSKTEPGWLTLIPRSNAWYQEYRGEFLFKMIEGDFMATTRVRASSRREDGAPRITYSLAGLLVRAPRAVTPQWQPGGENYLFHTFGVSSQPGVWEFQTMNTMASTSSIATSEGPDGEAILRVLRIGPHFVLAAAKRDDAGWRILWRHHRPDLPQRLQVGLMCSTDWVMCQTAGRERYDSGEEFNGRPDLIAQYDYVRFDRPELPAELVGKPLSDSEAVPDYILMKFLTSQSTAGAANSASSPSPPTPLPADGEREEKPTPDSESPSAKSSTPPSPRLGGKGSGVRGSVPAADDIASLSDEFDKSGTISDWKHVYEVEKWGANQLEKFDIDKSRRGKMVMMPFTSSWYKDLRGVLAFKEITGDFVVTTDVEVTNRSGKGAPKSQFSLAGIMVRTPRDVTPQTWKPGGENYIFLSLGAADRPNSFQFEVKTTRNSDSQLQISDGVSRATIQIVRIGQHFITIKKPAGGAWTVHHRYHRSDMPATLQVGLTSYTDWGNVQQYQNDPQRHNRMVIRGGNPDLVAAFDFVRYHRPQLPAALAGRNLSDPSAVSDDMLLRFLGDAAATRASAETVSGVSN